MKIFSLSLLAFGIVAGSASAQSLQLVSGNGQIVSEQFVSTVPFVVRAVDAAGRPQAGVPVTWSLKQGEGTIAVGASTVTDSNGLASAGFLATSIFNGSSFVQSIVSATAPVGTVDFVITTVALRTPSGGQASPPFINLEEPTTYAVSGPAGSIIPGGLKVRVVGATGFQAGQGVPNIGVRIRPADDSVDGPAAVCSGPGGIALTDDRGLAVCDLVLNGKVGVAQFTGVVGEIQNTPRITLTITAAQTCTFTISPTFANLGAAGGTGAVAITTTPACSYTSNSNAPWLTITAGGAGTGSGTVQYTAAANTTGAARSGTLNVAGQTFTVTETANSGVPPGTGTLAFTTNSVLPPAIATLPYSVSLGVTGGAVPYTFAATTPLPAGLALNPTTGTISGTIANAGNYTFSIASTDAANQSITQSFTLSVTNPANGTAFQITTSALPGGSLGVPYSQPITTANSCSNPFSAQPTFAVITGTLPAGLNLQNASIVGTPTLAGTSSFTVRATDSCGNVATRDLSIAVTSGSVVNPPPATSTLTAAPAALTFSAAAFGTAPPPQSITLTSSAGAVSFTVAVVGAAWLSINQVSGTTPATLTFVANPIGYSAGSYSGSVVVTTATGTLTIPVSLAIAAGPTLTVSPLGLSLDNATAGIPKALTISSNPLGVAFTVTATTLTGGNWLLVTPSSGTTPSAVAVSADAAGLPIGVYSGVITVIPTANPGAAVVIPVTLNVIELATVRATPTALSFQAATGAVTAPMIVTLASTGAPVRFTTSATVPWIQLTPQTGTTPATLLVSINPALLQPGVNRGVVNVTPETTRLPIAIAVTATLDDTSAEVTAVVNAASFAPGPVAPGEIITIFGTNLSPAGLTTGRVTDGKLETTVSGVRVLFDEIAAPILYASPTQISAIVPYQLYGRASTRLQVERGTFRTIAREVRVTDAAPAIFVVNPDGQAAVVNQDGSVNGAASAADVGSVVSIYATGEGQTNPPGVNGRITPALTSELALPLLPVTAQIGGQKADVLYAGSAPGLAAGAMQVNVRIPPGTPKGAAVPVLITVGGLSSQPGVVLAIK